MSQTAVQFIKKPGVKKGPVTEVKCTEVSAVQTDSVPSAQFTKLPEVLSDSAAVQFSLKLKEMAGQPGHVATSPAPLELIQISWTMWKCSHV
jgi:hypothetical protein